MDSPVKAPQATGDLGMVRVDRRVAWLPVEHAVARTTMARSNFCARPFLPELEVALPPFLSRPSSVPLEYRGSKAEHPDARCSIGITTRRITTLQSLTPALFLPQVAGAAQEPRREST